MLQSLDTNSKNVFYAIKKENKFVLYNSKAKKVDKKFYTDIVFDKEYPIFRAKRSKRCEKYN